MVVTHPADDPWIRRFHPRAEVSIRLVCFPYAAGSAAYYFPLSLALPGNVELVSVQYPGRQDRYRERRIESIAELADGCYAALKPWTDKPLAFFGYSMGAMIAFEVARRFQAGSLPGAAQLFVAARRGPAVRRADTVHLLDDEGLAQELRRLGATDAQWLDDPELRASVLPLARSDYTAVETYRLTPGSPVTCPITALVGDHDPYTTLEDAAAWQAHTTGRFDLRVFPGGHFFVEQHREALTGLLVDTLSGVLRGRPAR